MHGVLTTELPGKSQNFILKWKNLFNPKSSFLNDFKPEVKDTFHKLWIVRYGVDNPTLSEKNLHPSSGDRAWSQSLSSAFLLPVYVRVCFSCVWFWVTLRTVTHQALLSVGFSRQKYWSGLPFLSPGDFPDPEIEPMPLVSPALAGGFFITSAIWEAHFLLVGASKASSY